MPSTATLAMVSIDCPDPQTVTKMSEFYQGVLGWDVAYEGDGYAMLKDGTAAALGFGVAEDFRVPEWPNHGTKQFHLDLGADDVEATVQHCVELGATKPEDQPGGDRWTVLLDPAGHPFCVTNLANWG
ncbi:VOC family protein [Branchiibius cervicis]|uniref:VOC family protein n=1 Tax=Branchiibius cervicis TaxID=908252 RepID=A0ABW2AUJ1_9MICO